MGMKHFDVDREDVFFERNRTNFELDSAYGYFTLSVRDNLDLILGADVEAFDDPSTGVSSRDLFGKLGLVWQPDPRFTLRLGAFEGRKPRFVSNQTLEPTQVAGFNQLYDDINGTRATGLGVAVDARPRRLLGAGASVLRRDLSVPVRDDVDGISFTEDADETIVSGYVAATLTPRLVATGEARWERWRSDSRLGLVPARLDTGTLPLALTYFGVDGFFASGRVTGVEQDGRTLSGLRRDDRFAVVDLAVGWRAPHSAGGLAAEVRNLFDTNFEIEDDNFRSTNERRADLLPQRTFMVRAALNF
jgi:hypothetical protein